VIDHRRLALAAACLTGVQVGAALVASRFAIEATGPTGLALLRYGIGAAVLVPVALAVGRVRIPLRDLLPIAVIGIGQFGVLIALLNLSLLSLTSARAALIFATLPLVTLMLAIALGRERATPAKALGAALSVLGVALALGESVWQAGSGAAPWAGMAAALASTLVGAGCSLAYRPYLIRYPTLPISALAMAASVLFLALLVRLDPPPVGWDGWAEVPWGPVVFVGLSSAGGYGLWLYALKHLEASAVTLFMSLSPLTALALDALIFDDPVGPGLLLGIAAVATGLHLALRRTQKA